MTRKASTMPRSSEQVELQRDALVNGVLFAFEEADERVIHPSMFHRGFEECLRLMSDQCHDISSLGFEMDPVSGRYQAIDEAFALNVANGRLGVQRHKSGALFYHIKLSFSDLPNRKRVLGSEIVDAMTKIGHCMVGAYRRCKPAVPKATV
jgi:hypothetical protein